MKAGTEIALDLEEIVMKCLAKDPADRYPDAHTLAVALDACSLAGHHRPPRGAPVRSSPPSARVSNEPTLAEKVIGPRPPPSQ